MSDWRDWIGRSETAHDRVSPATLARLAGLLDHGAPPWPAGEAPPLFHWFHFLPDARQSTIGADGHPERGDFLPPIALPRRMWAGSRIDFLGAAAIDAEIERRTTIADVVEKAGASGPLAFVTLRHEIFAGGAIVAREEQDIVYRGESSKPSPAPTASTEIAEATRTITADPVLLFRFSALTYNAHRIHYDRDYARDVEHYPGLVVHGPLLATLLLDHALRAADGRQPARFAFSARRPLFDGAPFDLCRREDGDTTRLWTRDRDGVATMTATMTATLDWRD